MACNHPIVARLFEHAAWILSKYGLDAEGRTPWGLLHGREARERTAEFGKTLVYQLLEQTREKTDVRW